MTFTDLKNNKQQKLYPFLFKTFLEHAQDDNSKGQTAKSASKIGQIR